MFVSYFSESVNGLDVGAPLKYKGVTIGKVERIMIGHAPKSIRESSVAVVYSIDVGMLRRKAGSAVGDFDSWIRRKSPTASRKAQLPEHRNGHALH